MFLNLVGDKMIKKKKCNQISDEIYEGEEMDDESGFDPRAPQTSGSPLGQRSSQRPFSQLLYQGTLGYY
jgi:hypothetical protein